MKFTESTYKLEIEIEDFDTEEQRHFVYHQFRSIESILKLIK
jgi:hypothetical protein